MSSTTSTTKRRCGPRQGSAIIWPAALDERYDIHPVTRLRWEKRGKFPPRDVFINGVAVGWKPETLERAERGEVSD
jgi:hypothetical protein